MKLVREVYLMSFVCCPRLPLWGEFLAISIRSRLLDSLAALNSEMTKKHLKKTVHTAVETLFILNMRRSWHISIVKLATLYLHYQKTVLTLFIPCFVTEFMYIRPTYSHLMYITIMLYVYSYMFRLNSVIFRKSIQQITTIYYGLLL